MSAPAARRADGDAAPAPRTVGVVCDYAEEGWPSMDLVAEVTADALRRHASGWTPAVLQPRMPRPFGSVIGDRRHARNADRFVGRYLAYPVWLRRHRGSHAVYHVVDHSYAHLVHALPAARTVVTCHDLDAFRSLLSPAEEPRPAWFRATMRRVLSGMRRAAAVVCDSAAVRDELAARSVVAAERLHVVPLPLHPAFSSAPDARADAAAAALLGPADATAPEVLHVGSTAPRKRIPLLLHAFAALRTTMPRARLVRVGGALGGAHRALAERLGLGGAMVELPPLERPVLAAVYRRAAVAVLPSAREGFGLPVLEAIACGTPVVAADLPVLREVGGGAVQHVAGDDPAAWARVLARVLAAAPGEAADRRAAGVRHAAAFNTAAYADGLAAVYRSVCRGRDG